MLIINILFSIVYNNFGHLTFYSGVRIPFFCQGLFGYLYHHSRAVQDYQHNNLPAIFGKTFSLFSHNAMAHLHVGAMVGPDMLI